MRRLALLVALLVYFVTALADPPPPLAADWGAHNGGNGFYLLGDYGCATGVVKTWAAFKACALQHPNAAGMAYFNIVPSGSCTSDQLVSFSAASPGLAAQAGCSIRFADSEGSCGSSCSPLGITDAVCAQGYTLTGGECVAGCVSQAGKEIDFEVSWAGVASDANPEFGCFEACRAKFTSGGRFDVVTSGGTRYNSFKGIARIEAEACGSGVEPGVTLGTPRVVEAAAAAATGTGIGGVGASRGTAAGFQASDGVNLARVATNTARLVDALVANQGAGGTGGTAGEGSGGSTCGGPSQPACATSLDESGVGATAGSMSTSVAASSASTESALQGQIDQLGGAAPQFEPGGGRWLPSLSSFLPAPSCTLEGLVLPVGPGHTQVFSMSLCSHAPYVRDFLYWAFALLTLFGIWLTLFASRGS